MKSTILVGLPINASYISYLKSIMQDLYLNTTASRGIRPWVQRRSTWVVFMTLTLNTTTPRWL